MTSVTQDGAVPVVEGRIIPEPEPEPEPEPASKADDVSLPEVTGVHTQPGGGISAVLSELEEYTYDIQGFITIKGLLSDQEVGAACGVVTYEAAMETLAKHPVLLDYVSVLVGGEKTIAGPPVLIPPGAEEVDTTPSDGLQGAVGVQVPGKRTPRHKPALEGSGVRAFFVLSDGQPALALLAASHRSAAPAPSEVLAQGAADAMLTKPELAAGDVVLCTSTLLYGFRSGSDDPAQRIASCEWAPGANKHRTMTEINLAADDMALGPATDDTSPFSPAGGVGHGLMWKPSNTEASRKLRLAELTRENEQEDERVKGKVWVCVLIAVFFSFFAAWIVT